MLPDGGRADEFKLREADGNSAVRSGSLKVHTRIVSRSAEKQMAMIVSGDGRAPARNRRLRLAGRALVKLADQSVQLGNARAHHAPGAAAIGAIELDLALLHGFGEPVDKGGRF